MLAMSIVVRTARSSDSAAASAVVRAVYEEHAFTWDPERYHSDLEDVAAAYDRFWVAERGSDVVGCVGIRSAPLVLEGADCSLERLYVLRAARGSGTGSALLAAALSGARAQGRRRIEIWSDKLLTDSHRLYRRFGARIVSERVNDDPDASAEWGLVLDLPRV